ncbi:MAG: hypothetical protein ACXWKM_00195 [Phenylobacterium sp.]
MRRLRFALIAAAIAAVGVAAPLARPGCAEAVGTETAYTPAERDFSVSFPAQPVISGRAATSLDDSSSRTYASERDGVSFVVQVDQYPMGIRAPAPNQRAYDLLLRAHALETDRRLVSIDQVELSGRPALQGVFTTRTGGAEQRRVLMAGHRVYQVSYASSNGHPAAGEGEAFLRSFKISSQ